jgi:UDPglucose 6-dehydrogenase
MKIGVIGAGYVGLVSAACFSETGYQVVCVDVDQSKISKLRDGILPIYEPGLEAVVKRTLQTRLLRFSSSIDEAIADVDVCVMAVGTPQNGDGSATLNYMYAAARDIGRHLQNDYTAIAVKSTVPVGTTEKVSSIILEELGKRNVTFDYDVVSNPEFLKEGAAVKDFMSPDRVIIGTESERARKFFRDLYAPFVRNHDRFLFMGVREAEMSKYAANAMLATRVSFMNEIAGICDQLRVDVESVRIGVGSDPRIGYGYIYPGCGYGGSCLPKDVRALISMAREAGLRPSVLEAVEERNELQKSMLFQKITGRFGPNLSGLTIGLWGLAFKPETDDVRDAPSLALLRQLVKAGARVKAYDPFAMTVARSQLPSEWFKDGRVDFLQDQYDVAKSADGLVLVTEWRTFRSLDVDQLAKTMRQRIIFDGRNLYDGFRLRNQDFEYFGIGR